MKTKNVVTSPRISAYQSARKAHHARPSYLPPAVNESASPTMNTIVRKNPLTLLTNTQPYQRSSSPAANSIFRVAPSPKRHSQTTQSPRELKKLLVVGSSALFYHSLSRIPTDLNHLQTKIHAPSRREESPSPSLNQNHLSVIPFSPNRT